MARAGEGVGEVSGRAEVSLSRTRFEAGNFTATVSTSPTGVPKAVAPDGATLYGKWVATGAVAVSTDYGASWSAPNSTTFAGGMSNVVALGDGEILVVSGTSAGHGGQLWRSSGWSTNRAGATFASVKEAAQTTVYFAYQPWGLSVHGPRVLAAEYGPKVDATNQARYVYMSTDYGATWSTVFDLYAETGVATGAHLHGVCIDPYWDALWVVSGDRSANVNTHVSFDGGATWESVFTGHQFTTVQAFPDYIVFGTDGGTNHTDGLGNGVYRAARGDRDSITVEQVEEFDTSSVVTVVGSQIYRNPTMPDAPAVLSFYAGDASGGGQLWVTYDGESFLQLWEDDQSYTNRGLVTAVGPLPDGSIVGHLDRPSGGDNCMLKVSLS